MIRTEITGAEIAEEMEKERRLFQLQMCEVSCEMKKHFLVGFFTVTKHQAAANGTQVQFPIHRTVCCLRMNLFFNSVVSCNPPTKQNKNILHLGLKAVVRKISRMVFSCLLKKVDSDKISVFSGTVRMRCGSNPAQARMNSVRDDRAETRDCTVAFDYPSCLNQNTATHGRCWGWQALQVAVARISKVKNQKKNNMHFNEEDFIAHGYVLHWCRDTIKCSKNKQVVQLLSSFCVLAVCKQTLCISPPTVLDYICKCAQAQNSNNNVKTDQWGTGEGGVIVAHMKTAWCRV